jgi:hypothetical protein
MKAAAINLEGGDQGAQSSDQEMALIRVQSGAKLS